MEYTEAGTEWRELSLDCVLTNAVLAELKKQAENGCLLCSFDTWDGEEWD